MVINRHHIKSSEEVITTTLGIPEDYKQKCIQEAYKIGDKQNQQTNVKAIMSSYHIWEESTVYNHLLENILRTVKNTLSYKLPPEATYVMMDSWAAIYKPGHYTVPHRHVGHVSYVYYLKANRGSSPLVFNGCDFQVDPHDDLLVMFPSYLTHSVPEHVGDDRICLAGNLEERFNN